MDEKIKKHITELLKINRELHENRDETYKTQHHINQLLVEAEYCLLKADKEYDKKHESSKNYQRLAFNESEEDERRHRNRS